MSVGADKLVRMAEQIAANITVSKDPDEIAARLADHMLRFWDPRMRQTLLSAAGAEGFATSEPVRRAIRLL